MKIVAVDKPEVPALEVSHRMRSEIVYYTSDPTTKLDATMDDGQYWIDPNFARQVLDDGVVRVASPLSVGNAAEIEISEDGERLLEWALEYETQLIAFRT